MSNQINSNSLAYRFKQGRKAKGWTQQDLAQEMGVSLFTISKIESGVHLPNLATLRKAAEALEIPIAELVELVA